MKTKLLFIMILTFIGLNNITHAQSTFIWAKSWGGGQTEEVSELHLQNKYLYTTGYFEGTTTFGNISLVSDGSADIFLTKCDTSGNIIWAKRAGGTGIDYGYSITTDNKHNVYLAGIFSDTLILNTDTLISSGAVDFFISKHDSLGNPIWATKGGGIADEYANNIQLDENGNIYITGYFWGTSIFDNIVLNSNGGYDIFLAKYDSIGNIIWAKNAGGSGWDYANSSVLGKNGNLLITGKFIGTAYFDSISLNTSWGNAVFIANYDSSGNIIWAKQAGGHYCSSQGNDVGYNLCTDTIGNVYVTGSFKSSTACFDTIILTNNGFSDIFIAKYDPNGNIQWAKQAGSSQVDEGRSITTDNDGSVYVTGFFSDTATFSNYSLTSIAGWDVFIAKYDYQGNIQWIKQGMGTGLNDYPIKNIVTDNSTKDSYIAGGFNSNINFDNISLNSNGWEHDIFVAKLGYVLTSISDRNNVVNSINIFPNPSNGQINVTSSSNIDKIIITDILGQIIFQTKLNDRNISLQLDRTGIYFITLIWGKQKVTRKLIVYK